MTTFYWTPEQIDKALDLWDKGLHISLISLAVEKGEQATENKIFRELRAKGLPTRRNIPRKPYVRKQRCSKYEERSKPSKPVNKSIRTCLGCGAPFLSTGIHNRMCTSCGCKTASPFAP